MLSIDEDCVVVSRIDVRVDSLDECKTGDQLL